MSLVPSSCPNLIRAEAPTPQVVLESVPVGSLRLTKDEATPHQTVKNSQGNSVLRRVCVTCFLVLPLLVVCK